MPSKASPDLRAEFLKIAAQWHELALDADTIATIRQRMKDGRQLSEKVAHELSQELCSQKIAECRALAKHASKDSQRIMLESIAETWERIANSLTKLA